MFAKHESVLFFDTMLSSFYVKWFYGSLLEPNELINLTYLLIELIEKLASLPRMLFKTLKYLSHFATSWF
jgi:hypothetical protein